MPWLLSVDPQKLQKQMAENAYISHIRMHKKVQEFMKQLEV